MNIKNRLKKLENEIIKDDPLVCDCPKEFKSVVILPTADGETYTEPPDLCETCGKPIEWTTIIVQGIASDIPNPTMLHTESADGVIKK